MAVNWTDNGTGSEVLLDLTVEWDDGLFLSLSDSEGIDLILTNESEVAYFFETVEKAKAQWERRSQQAEPT